MANQAETLRQAIENLVDAKLVDAMARPDGLNRLLAHRRTGVASPDIRNAERKLEETLSEMLVAHDNSEAQLA
jgi:predicted RNA-binding Zn ribbon-like protein